MNEIFALFADADFGLYILMALALVVLPTALVSAWRANAKALERLDATVSQWRTSEQKQRDLTELAQREQGRMRAVLSAMKVGILFEDKDHRVEYVNPAFLSIWSIEPEFGPVGRYTSEVLEHSSSRIVRPEHASGRVFDADDTAECLELDFRDGRIITQNAHAVADADGNPIGRMWLYEDVTHQRQTAEKLLFLAERDPLTGLYNRHRFQEHLEHSIAVAMRNHGRFALVYFDLDEFKYINDTFGHKAGDTVLVKIANEISNMVRSTETFARLGGDEFAILCNLNEGDDPCVLPSRIISAIGTMPFRFRGISLRLTGSVGIAIFPEHGDNAEDLVAHADTAMYQAKTRGKNTWALYSPDSGTSEAMVRRLSWNRRLADALEKNLFELHFQGVYDSAGRQLSHLEVFVRMTDPADPRLPVMPDEFIHAAEKSGQITDVDRWVLARAIEHLGKDPALPPLSVNLSARSFADPQLPQFIRATLEAHKVTSERLIIALTETAALSDIQGAQKFIEVMRGMGCRVCLDEFGSGFSAFAYLKYLGADILKIDGSFIRNLPVTPDHQVFVKAMVDVASGLQKKLVASFVEDEPTLNLLRELGVPLVQGYHFDRPVADHPALKGSPY